MKDERRKAEQPEVLVGIDVGSTTTKIVVMQTGNSDYKVVFSNYERHHADQLKSVLEILKNFDEKMPAQKVRVKRVDCRNNLSNTRYYKSNFLDILKCNFS